MLWTILEHLRNYSKGLGILQDFSGFIIVTLAGDTKVNEKQNGDKPWDRQRLGKITTRCQISHS